MRVFGVPSKMTNNQIARRCSNLNELVGNFFTIVKIAAITLRFCQQNEVICLSNYVNIAIVASKHATYSRQITDCCVIIIIVIYLLKSTEQEGAYMINTRTRAGQERHKKLALIFCPSIIKKHTRYKNNYDYAYRKNAEKSTRLSDRLNLDNDEKVNGMRQKVPNIYNSLNKKVSSN